MQQGAETLVIDAGETRRERLALAAIALVAAVPMVHMAVHHRIDYDGWWHVFIARASPWAQFWVDVGDNAHPPVFYLLLRAVAWLGSERLVFRSLSIVAAVVATYVVGRIASRVFRTPGVSLVCALAFGFALSTVVMACAVRSYMLSVALLLVAFRLYLDLIDPRPVRPTRATGVWFVVALVGAIVTHYAAIFFAGVAAALPCLYAAVDGRYRAWLGERLRARWRAVIATIVPIAAVVVAVYVAHVSGFDAPMTHTAPFYPSPAESAAGPLRGSVAFLSRSIVAEIDLLSPLSIAALPAAARALVVLLVAGLGAGLLLILGRRADWVVAAAPTAALALLAIGMMVAALLGRYPFGGFLRHQFILFPFVVLAGFALVDEIAARLPRRRLALAAVAMTVLLSSSLQWRRLAFADQEPAAEEVAQFTRAFADSRAVYVDRFSLIPFIANHPPDRWSTQVGVGDTFVAVPVVEDEGTLLVLRDTRRWNSDLSDRRLYRDLRQAMALAQLPAIDLFRLRQDAYLLPPASRQQRADLADAVIQTAAGEHLDVERLVLDGLHVYARLRPSDGAPH
jgi:hypothetical protein